MPSKTLYFNKTLFWKNVTRFWPLWLIYTVNWMITLPLPFFLEKMRTMRYGGSSDWLQTRADSLLDVTRSGVLGSFLFGVLIAMAVFSYLYNSRSAGLMHTLPIRREGLFLTSWLSGYCFMLVPHLLVALLTIAAELFAGTVNLWNVWMWFLIQSGTALFFYSFAVFCAMFTGHILALPAFYSILLFLAYFFSSILDTLLSFFILGFTSSTPSPLVQWLTPVFQMKQNLHYRDVVDAGVNTTLFTGFQYVLIYMLVAVVLTIAALFLYRRRQVETSGDVIAVSWAKPIFKYGFALCVALCGGLFLFFLFDDLFSSNWLPLTVFTVISGALGCFIAEMFLQKTFKVFHTAKSSLVFSAAVLILMVILQMDLLGLGTWVPQVSEVKSVSISSSSLPPHDSASDTISLEDEESIRKAINIHQTIIEHGTEFQQQSQVSNSTLYVSIFYDMKDGSFQRKNYSIPSPEDGALQTSVNEQILELVNDPSNLLRAYFPYEAYGAQATQIIFEVYNTETRQTETRALDAVLSQQVLQGMRTDILAGRLGIHYLNDEDPGRTTNCSYYDFQVEWVYTDDQGESYSRSTLITPQFTATETLRILTEAGILDETHILRSVEDVWAEQERMPRLESPHTVSPALPN